MTVESVLAVVVVLGLCLMFHEGGHFLAAKLSRMKVDEFGIGFPIRPCLFSFERGGTRYSFYWLLIGAFVRIRGMEPGEEEAPDGFYSKAPWKRAATLLAGPVMNLVLAALFFWTLGALYGEVVGAKNVVGKVLPGQPAEAAGVKPGDRILAIDGHWHSTKVERVEPGSSAARAGLQPDDTIVAVNGTEVADYQDMIGKMGYGEHKAKLSVEREDKEGNVEDVEVAVSRLEDAQAVLDAEPRSTSPAVVKELGVAFAPLEWANTVALTQTRAGREMTMVVVRDGRRMSLKMVPARELVKTAERTESGRIETSLTEIGRVGIAPVIIYRKLGLIGSARWSVTQTYMWIRAYIGYFGLVVRGKASAELTGPIGIAREIGDTAKLGLSPVLRIAGMISLIIGVLNVVPFPGLDGARLASTAYEAVLRRPLNRRREALINAVGIAILVVVLIAICFNDVIDIVVSRSRQ